MHEYGDNPADDDAELLARAAAGEEPAFVALYRRHADEIHALALAFAKSRSVAEDVTQEVFLNVLENAARFDPAKGSARAWLYGCARHVVIDRLRQARRFTDSPPEESAPCNNAESLHSEQRLERLHAAIARLPIGYRETLIFCELQQLSYTEAASVLRCPIGTVRSRLHRARAALAVLLADASAPATESDGPAATSSGLVARLGTSEVCS